MIALVAALGCGGDGAEVRLAYEAARAEALAEPAPVRPRWTPDATLHLSASLTARLLERGLAEVPEIRGPVPIGAGVVARPRLDVDGVTLDGAGRCPRCVVATVHLTGTVVVDAAGLVTASVPVEAAATLEAALDVARTDAGFALSVTPERVRRVTLPDLTLPASIARRVEAELQRQVEAALVDAEPIVALRVADDALPVRLLAARVSAEGRGVRVDLRTAAITVGPPQVPAPAPTPADWTLSVSAASALALARREAFLAGPLVYGIVGVPDRATLDGDRFTLGLRLWRVGDGSGGAWWRDYEASGRIVADGQRVSLAADAVVAAGASEGAGWADPLAAVGQPKVRSALADALTRSRSATVALQTPNGPAELAVTEIVGAHGGVIVRGDARLP